MFPAVAAHTYNAPWVVAHTARLLGTVTLLTDRHHSHIQRIQQTDTSRHRHPDTGLADSQDSFPGGTDAEPDNIEDKQHREHRIEN